jgi:hypothetical protein
MPRSIREVLGERVLLLRRRKGLCPSIAVHGEGSRARHSSSH